MNFKKISILIALVAAVFVFNTTATQAQTTLATSDQKLEILTPATTTNSVEYFKRGQKIPYSFKMSKNSKKLEVLLLSYPKNEVVYKAKKYDGWGTNKKTISAKDSAKLKPGDYKLSICDHANPEVSVCDITDGVITITNDKPLEVKHSATSTQSIEVLSPKTGTIFKQGESIPYVYTLKKASKKLEVSIIDTSTSEVVHMVKRYDGWGENKKIISKSTTLKIKSGSYKIQICDVSTTAPVCDSGDTFSIINKNSSESSKKIEILSPKKNLVVQRNLELISLSYKTLDSSMTGVDIYIVNSKNESMRMAQNYAPTSKFEFTAGLNPTGGDLENGTYTTLVCPTGVMTTSPQCASFKFELTGIKSTIKLSNPKAGQSFKAGSGIPVDFTVNTPGTYKIVLFANVKGGGGYSSELGKVTPSKLGKIETNWIIPETAVTGEYYVTIELLDTANKCVNACAFVQSREFKITSSVTTPTNSALPVISMVIGKAGGDYEVYPGESINIQGTNLMNTSKDTKVFIAGKEAKVTQYDKEVVYFTAPELADGTYDLTVRTSAGSSNVVKVFVKNRTTEPNPGSCSFTQDLTLGSVGQDVVNLQDFLEKRGFLTLPAGNNNGKGYFGLLTRTALARYQASVGISPANGYFGLLTRTKIATECGNPPVIQTHLLSFNTNGADQILIERNLRPNETTILPSNLTKSGYTFEGWATTQTGPARYEGGESFRMSSSYITLYAVWKAIQATTPTIKVLSPNGGEQIVPGKNTDPLISWSAEGVSGVFAFLVPANSKGNGEGSLGILGYVSSEYSVMGWNAKTVFSSLTNGKEITVPPGRYKIYLVGNIAGQNNKTVSDMSDKFFTISAPPQAEKYLISFDSNGGEGIMLEKNIAKNEKIKLPTNSFTKTGHKFDGWSTTKNAMQVYGDQSSFTMGSANVVLYARWKKNETPATPIIDNPVITTHSLSFNGNGATSGSTRTQTCTTSTRNGSCSVTIPTNNFDRKGYTFDGWAESANGNHEYNSGQQYTNLKGNVTLYARWKAQTTTPTTPIATYTVTFDGNGATSGSTRTMTLAKGKSEKLSTNNFAKTGHKFDGWSTTKNAMQVYGDQSSFTMGSANVVLYARWKKNETPVTPPANVKPNKPTISGPTTGIVGTAYNFKVKATDPNNDKIKYAIDWDNDGKADMWSPAWNAEFINSGTEITISKTWNATGTKTFKVLTRDAKGLNSDWTTHKIVISPKPKATASVSEIGQYSDAESVYPATIDLELGQTDPSVITLQKYLNSNGYIIESVLGELGSIGYESDYFGEKTKQALIKFQKDKEISPAQGYFGAKTRAAMGM